MLVETMRDNDEIRELLNRALSSLASLGEFGTNDYAAMRRAQIVAVGATTRWLLGDGPAPLSRGVAVSEDLVRAELRLVEEQRERVPVGQYDSGLEAVFQTLVWVLAPGAGEWIEDPLDL